MLSGGWDIVRYHPFSGRGLRLDRAKVGVAYLSSAPKVGVAYLGHILGPAHFVGVACLSFQVGVACVYFMCSAKILVDQIRCVQVHAVC